MKKFQQMEELLNFIWSCVCILFEGIESW